MTSAQYANHCLTHLPYHPGCAYCVAGKRNNSHHRRVKSLRTLPHVVADYGFLRDSNTEDTLPILVVRIWQFKMYFVCAVDLKGPNIDTVLRLSRWL